MQLRTLHFGHMILELDRLRLIGPNGPIALRPKTFDVLRYLVDHAGRVVPKGEIIAAVWPDVIVTEESLTRCVSEIRKALDREDQSLFRTVQRRGYVFDGRVTASNARSSDLDAEPLGLGTSKDRGPKLSADAKKRPPATKRQITVLYVNCERWIAKITTQDPEHALEVYRVILTELVSTCSRFGGSVTSISENAIVALFGAPSASEDHAVQACHAALEFRGAMLRFPMEGRSASHIGIAVASGEVIVDCLADLGYPQTVLTVGPVIYAAKSLSAETADGILIASSTRERIVGVFYTKAISSPGARADPIYELIAPARQSRFEAATMRGLTPFVGRDLELAHMKRVATAAFSGRGQIIALIGEAGVGKSRLLHEFVHALEPDACQILVAGAPSHRTPTSFQLFSDLIKGQLCILAEDDTVARRRKAHEAVTTLASREPADLFACLSLIDEAVDDPAWAAFEPSMRRDRILSVGKKLLLDIRRRQPLLIILEDLHWLDADSQEAVDSLIDSIALLPVLVLVSYRPEYAHKWHGKTYYSQLRLDELPEKECRELLTYLLGSDRRLIDNLGLVNKEGNPLFLEELVRSFADEHILEGQTGAYSLARPIGRGFRIPAAIQAVLSARIDRLPPRERQLLQAASVIGDEAPVDILRALAQLPTTELDAALAQLQTAEFLYEDRSSADRCYRFKHALTRSVAYDSQLSDQRAALHRNVVSAIEQNYPLRRFEHIEQLAHHAIRGGMGMTAVRYGMKAAEKAFARFANREAAALYENALGALDSVPESLERQVCAIDIRCRLDHALYLLAEFGKIEVNLREAERIALNIDDQQHLGWVSIGLAALYFTGSRGTAEARKQAARAEQIAKEYGNRKLLVAAQYYLTWAAYTSGKLAEAESISRRSIRALRGSRALEPLGTVFPAIRARGFCARALAEQGHFSEAEDVARDAIRMSEEINHPSSLSLSCFALGHALRIKGHLDEAERVLRRAFEQCVLWKMDTQTPPMQAHLGYVRALQGHLPEGISLLEHALQSFEKTGIEHLLSISLSQLGEAYLLADRVEEARSCALRALAVAKRRGEQGFKTLALRLLGGVEMAQGRQEEALRHYDNALRSALRLKMRPLAVLCHLGLHVAYARMGDGGEAEENEAAVGALLSGLGMRVDAGIEVTAHSKMALHQVTKSTIRVGRRSGSFLGSAKHV